jgi:hypothetical protein
VTVIEEEREQTLKFAQAVEEDHTVEDDHSMGEGIGHVGGLVEQSRTRRWLPGDSHADHRRKAFNRIAQKFHPRS